MNTYAKIVVPGSPITKSNFKLHNKDGRAILPSNTGKSHDRYAIYEEKIAYYSRLQNPGVVLEESLIAILKVYYKSEKRHPDTANITKSIFDGIEKSGLIVNDAQITRIITEEFYDKENPRFELEFFAESKYKISYSVEEKTEPSDKKIYSSLKKNPATKLLNNKSSKKEDSSSDLLCEFCKKKIKEENIIKGNGGKTLICRTCFNKLF
ncbi:MAG: RusA family crossover junction endodeoxyribonuclease [Clostridium sp.]|uniref:RusA family crossover junction endodeoxyribonuclease n=1 Tax=Clostridium sp. TaxID=1506 RepID=UPI0025C14517|nr:RusA family crossover junction endodeoxyribonuclease [Clostridium sp.]MCF0148074.1 RusA family crossover junction endodeoxyribonuclease [Clostridium sp.]